MALSETTNQSITEHFEVWMRIGLSTARADRYATERARRFVDLLGTAFGDPDRRPGVPPPP